MSKNSKVDLFDNLFGNPNNLFGLNPKCLYQQIQQRKVNEYNFYNKVMETYNKLSDIEKGKFDWSLLMDSGSSNLKKSFDYKLFNEYIRLRCGIDYDFYNGNFNLFDREDLSIRLDKLSRHLYGKYYQDFILFKVGYELLGKKDVRDILRGVNYENTVVSVLP